jgi:hypothetical protein
MVDRAPSIDLTEFSPARLSGKPLDEAQLTAACVWQYEHYYDPAAGCCKKQPEVKSER